MSHTSERSGHPPEERATRSWRDAKRVEAETAQHERVRARTFAEPPALPPESLTGETLEDLQSSLDLDDATLASLLDVAPHTLEQWRRDGIPQAYDDAIVRLRETAARLQTHHRGTAAPVEAWDDVVAGSFPASDPPPF